MRDFSKTPEPTGKTAREPAGNSFVVHKHAARRLHYDFRLELDGVLLSWSVPKGPSLHPSHKRLAVRTEDHPLDYAEFEGVIPPGQYGGGAVIVWDRGTWELEPGKDPHAALAAGRLSFELHGEKLRGRWHLVRTKGETKSWLLFKSDDGAANENIDIVQALPESVVSGRTIEQVTAQPDRVWRAPSVQQRRAARFASAAREVAQARRVKPAKTTAELIDLVAQLPLGFPLTSLDKVLYPDHGLTKGQLIAYLAVVAEWMLPHVANRPLTIVRCPEGRKKPCFYQKHLLPGSPPAIRPVAIENGDGEPGEYMTIADMPGLVALGQLGTLEIHTWGAHADQPECPDLMVFDLDPDVGLGWEKIALAAFAMRRKLHDLGLDSWLKTTGGKGLHVVVPVERRLGWDDFKQFAKQLVETMEAEDPSAYTTNMAKRARKGKVFLDYLRNGRNATFIAPYSPRARDGAPVAVPITWEELAHGIDPLAFTTASVPRRLAGLREDPWKDIHGTKQSITAAAWRAVGGKP